jgi:SAM-dependent methyltransferase
VLARWSGWGAIPHIFDDNDDRLVADRAELRRLLGTEAAWAQARRTTLNAHYTSAAVVQAMWRATGALGATGPLRVLEPGCGSGNFLGFAPDRAQVTGVELDGTTAAIARHLYGARADIHVGPLEELRVEDGAYDVVVGNVPFAQPRVFARTCAR